MIKRYSDFKGFGWAEPSLEFRFQGGSGRFSALWLWAFRACRECWQADFEEVEKKNAKLSKEELKETGCGKVTWFRVWWGLGMRRSDLEI